MPSTPRNFDARKKWPGLIQPVPSSQHCGSCWASTAADVLGDRTAIALGKTPRSLSTEDLLTCAPHHGASHGAKVQTAWEHLNSIGIATESCIPFVSSTGRDALCQTDCADGSHLERIRSRSSYAIVGEA